MAATLALLGVSRPGRVETAARFAAYHADVGILFNLFTFTVDGRVEEQVDRNAGSYRVVVAGEGSGITNRIESTGAIREGRLVPTLSTSRFTVRGRESQTWIRYDYERRVVHYRHVSETFFLGRLRVAEDVLEIPAGQRVDDIVSAALNYAGGRLEVDATPSLSMIDETPTPRKLV